MLFKAIVGALFLMQYISSGELIKRSAKNIRKRGMDTSLISGQKWRNLSVFTRAQNREITKKSFLAGDKFKVEFQSFHWKQRVPM